MWSRPPDLVRRCLVLAAASVAVILAASACGSSARVSTGPTPVKCQVALTASTEVLAADGGSGTIAVATNPECSWTVTTPNAWIVGVAPQSGQGSGSVEFTVAPNAGLNPREGQITVNDAQVHLRQEPASCVYELTPRRHLAEADGGPGELSVVTMSGCAWNASTDAPWITITSSPTGSGTGVLQFFVPENTTAARSGSVIVADQVTVIDQAQAMPVQPGCVYTLGGSSASIPAEGGAGSVAVQSAANCTWTAASLVPWISITSGTRGSGVGTVSVVVGANPGAPRTGALRIAGHLFTITQAGAANCTFSISPAGQSLTAAGGAGQPVTVSAAAGCTWTATSNASWIALTSSGSGSGPGAVSFDVGANPGPARTGTLTIAGHVFTVTQAGVANCTFSVSPAMLSFGAGGGNGGPVSVSTGAGCNWTATSDASWITLTSGSGSGNGTVSVEVSPNTGPARTATLTVAGQTVSVTQASGCTYSISPTSQPMPAAGGADLVGVVTAAGCDWTATANVGWITLTRATSGSGNGSVDFAVAANSGATRTGTVTIAGQDFTVIQAAAPACSFSINPTTGTFVASGGSGTVNVSTASGCAWSARSNASWIRIVSGASGSGSGATQFEVDFNILFGRTGTLTIAGHTFSVSQGGLLLSSGADEPGRRDE